MKGLELVVKFWKNDASLAHGHSLSLGQAGIPVTIKEFKSPAYWKVKVVNYIRNERRLFCEIITYHTGDISYSDIQIENSDELRLIENIAYRTIDTGGLLNSASGQRNASTYTPPRPEFVRRSLLQSWVDNLPP